MHIQSQDIFASEIMLERFANFPPKSNMKSIKQRDSISNRDLFSIGQG
jgi:hypothetical protein